ncbi:DEAD/DEAH box helicase [Nocardia stercoris]|uniref:DEAD/DEAH box helicase n=1 Tax=Nocardia stercoris TaxID=2483361 RepID=A0A3M2LC10_9NOCA|nr:DEAD/DEAH box helicase [Nocardia stercoris]RMI32218.1 DEAD/DEAH box helicase [Nocardia stercoris]
MNSETPSFAALGVRDPLVRALTRAGITAPFPIQADTLPSSLAGRDVLGRGRTGSGKTLAFSIPMVDRLGGPLAGRTVPNRPTGLVLAPTRELATQIATAIEPLAQACELTVTTVFGGVPQQRQVRALRAGVDIVVACPGRLEDLMKQGLIALDAVKITVIDEADHMADLGFLPGVTRILAATPQGSQRLLFSATLDNGVNKLVERFLPQAVRHSVDSADSPVAAMTHHVFETADVAAKREVVHRLASGEGRRILFTRTKHQARKLAKQLTTEGIPAVDLHGNLSQAARDRNLASFAAGEARVLVATDVAARGVHVDGVELVVHVDAPAEHKAYLHRSGRTARAGNAGDVITLMLPAERRDVAALLRKASIEVTPQRVTAASPEVAALVGTVAAPVAPKPAPAPQQSQGRSGGRRRSGDVAPQRQSRGQSSGRPQRSAPGEGQPSGRGQRRPQGEGPANARPQRSAQGDNRSGSHSGDGRSAGRGQRAPQGEGRPGGRSQHRSEGAGGDRAQGRQVDRAQGRQGDRAQSRRSSGDTTARSAGTRTGAAPAGSSGGLAGFSRSGGGARRRAR